MMEPRFQGRAKIRYGFTSIIKLMFIIAIYMHQVLSLFFNHFNLGCRIAI